IRDGSGIIQCVVSKGDVAPEVFSLADSLTQESSLQIVGRVRADKRSPIGFEIGVTEIRPVGGAADYPISPKEHGTAFLMDHRHLWIRSSRQHAILRVRSEIIRASREYFDGNGFTLLDAPILTPAACEGTTTLFETDYFGTKAYLSQSGQLYMEAGAMAFGKVYCFGPTFRSEKSKTRRHLMEFWMIEPECAFFDLGDDMDLAEDYVATLVARVLERRRTELLALERDLSKLEAVRKPFPRITYDDAIEIINKKGGKIEWGSDFGGDEETILSEQFDRPALVHHYPAEVKAFYMKRDPENPKLALNVDLIAPEGYGEVIGGGQREDDFATLKARLEEHKLPPEAFSWYLDLRRYGSVPHAGFGLGIERTV
ncbi:MAG: asparagine--tRNA ligase, partial [Vicinamibacteria bacterium]